MRVSAKVEYACLAVFELAGAYAGEEPVRIRQIASRHGIPSRFLVQILLQLKGAGLVTSTRGAAGGYRLARPPDRITLWDVMSVIEGREEPAANPADATPAAHVLAECWREAAAAQQGVLRRITFGTLIERARRQSANMYYI
ncbi:MAG: Rrf2 family transcriptional regulator [Pirellulales bacterium]|nr:Rrf2 family transcriptional regulator [Pirellulales bacterium]